MAKWREVLLHQVLWWDGLSKMRLRVLLFLHFIKNILTKSHTYSIIIWPLSISLCFSVNMHCTFKNMVQVKKENVVMYSVHDVLDLPWRPTGFRSSYPAILHLQHSLQMHLLHYQVQRCWCCMSYDSFRINLWWSCFAFRLTLFVFLPKNHYNNLKDYYLSYNNCFTT